VGLLSEDDSISSGMRAQAMLDPHDILEDDNLEGDLIVDDDNYMLDITQELPIRKPQSAYVIFGKMVRRIEK
jgi:hypothetical protein